VGARFGEAQGHPPTCQPSEIPKNHNSLHVNQKMRRKHLDLADSVTFGLSCHYRAVTRHRSLFVTMAILLPFLLLGCGREAPAPVVVTPAIPTATATATATPTATARPTPTATATTMAESPPRAAGNAAAPAIVDAEGNCLIESDLDLAGYPELQDQMGCAVEQATYDDVAINEFGEGPDFNRFMLWFSNSEQIFVLLPNQTWEAFPDTWSEDQPEISCNPLDGEATSPPLPRRGFGKLWCEVPELQELMGTIVREERLCQNAVTQQFEAGRLLACFEDATIRYFRILDDGSWDMVFVQ